MGLLAHPSFVFATAGAPLIRTTMSCESISGPYGAWLELPHFREPLEPTMAILVWEVKRSLRARESYCSWAMCVGTLVSHSPCELQVDPRSNMIHHWCWHVPEGCLWDLGTIFRAEANSQFRISDWIDGKALKGRDCSDVCNVCNVSRIFLIFLVLGRWHLLGWPLAAEFCSAPGPSHSGQ